MIDWTIAVPSFLTAFVEWVEAFTIVLAVSLTIGWRAALGASVAALLTLAAMTAAVGNLLTNSINVGLVRLVIGIFLLLFGVRWLAKAIARHAGLKALHDEAREFEETREKVTAGDRNAAWIIAYKGVLLEGLEVWLIVVSLGARHPSGHGLLTSGGAAIGALFATVAVGLAVKAPLQRIPENGIKFAVGVMIVSFGVFWTMESIGGEGIWPLGDWSLLILASFFLLVSLAAATMLRARTRKAVA